MNRFLLMCLLPLISTFANCGDLSPSESAKKCSYGSLDPQPFFGPFGHSNTTYKVAEMARRFSGDFYTLSYFSQYPDEDKEYDAIVNSIKNKIPLLGNEFTGDVVKKLHSLHGGDHNFIQNRRKSLEYAIRTNLKNPNDAWKAGLLIHAYGDTFAHTKGKYGSEDEKAFGPAVGHLFHSIFVEDPDQVTKDKGKEKYLAYVDHLFDVLKSDSADENSFLKFKNKIKDTSCTNDNCLKFEVLETRNIKNIDKFNRCMSTNMKPLTVEQVQEVLDKIQ